MLSKQRAGERFGSRVSRREDGGVRMASLISEFMLRQSYLMQVSHEWSAACLGACIASCYGVLEGACSCSRGANVRTCKKGGGGMVEGCSNNLICSMLTNYVMAIST